MRIFLLIILAMLLQHPLKAQQKVYTIPFTYHNEKLLFIQVEVAGRQGTNGFIFDTGGANVINTYSFGKDADRKPAFIRMGDFQLNDPTFQKDDYSKRFQSADYHQLGGMLGLEAFKGWVFQIDYNQQLIRVAKTTEELGSLVGEKIPLQVKKAPLYTRFFKLMPRYQAWVNLDSDEIEALRFTLDTGASFGFGHHTNVLKNRNKKSPFLHKVAVDTIEGRLSAPYLFSARDVQAYMVGLNNSRLGNFQLPQLQVMFSSMGSGVVGNAFLRDYLVTIDMAGKAIYLKEQPYQRSMATGE